MNQLHNELRRNMLFTGPLWSSNAARRRERVQMAARSAARPYTPVRHAALKALTRAYLVLAVLSCCSCTFAQAAGNGDSAPVGSALPTFSSLSPTRQLAVRRSAAPPPLAERSNPYSVPMYYPQWGGSSPDGKFHPEWQEALIRDWADLGLTKLHLYLYPNGTGTDRRDYALDETTRLGIQEFVRLCRKHSMRFGLRIDLPYALRDPKDLPPGSDPTAEFWPAHPDNPKNELQAYSGWLRSVLTLLKGNCEYLIVGDEMNFDPRKDGRAWSPEIYMRVFRQVSSTAHSVDPHTRVCMYSAESGRWNEVRRMLREQEYARYADAVAINHYDYNAISAFMTELKKLSPHKNLPLLSNGVGYIASDTPDRNPPHSPYSTYNDTDQASMIARTMYTWWALGAEVAPYYVCVRDVVYHGRKMPQWYGFFGFMDLVIDNQDNASVTHYPGWYAFRTIAQVFHDRPSFQDARFHVAADSPRASYVRAYERGDKELLIVLWSDDSAVGKTNVRIDSSRYGYPVQVGLMNPDSWSDLPATKERPESSGITLWNVPLGKAPTIIRLVRTDTDSRPGAAAHHAASEGLPAYDVVRAPSAPAIDGRLTDAVWRRAPHTRAFRNSPDGSASEDKTTVQMAWDDRALYVAFTCAFTTPPKAELTARDSPVWTEENVELLLDVSGPDRTLPQMELLSNALGTQADLRWATSDLESSLKWNASGVRVAARVSGAGSPGTWTAEYEIPFQALLDTPGARPRPGDTWRVGLYRKIVTAKDPILQAWSPTLDPSFHRPERFGYVRFAGAAPSARMARAASSP